MNKTVTINISGIIFHIEEDAYDSLSKYLATIKGYFSNTDGGNEIMGDIEARIAELLQEKINASKQVILMVDVDYVKNVMGRPEEFGGEQNKAENNSNPNTASEEQYEYTGEKMKRRLFRNPDEKAIGGVCSGLAAYFNIDTVWVRLAMFLLIFFGGLSLWVYIILWIVIPQAKTTAEKFAMRGENANINNIYQSFKEEATDAKNRFTREATDMKDRFNRNKGAYRQEFYDASQSARRGGAEVLNTLFNIMGRLIGLFLLAIGGILLFAYIASLFGISIADSNNDMTHWKAVIFESPSDYAWGIVAFIIVFGIPVFMLIYAGVKLLFKIRYSNRWLNLSLGIVWMIGLILGSVVAVNTVKQFSDSSKIKEVTELHNMGDTIVIKLNPAATILKALKFDNEGDLDVNIGHHNNVYYFGEDGNKRSIIGFAGLDVVENTSDSVELVIYQSAKGGDKKEANENARAITYSYRQEGNTLYFDEIFSVAAGSKFRAPDIDIKLKLPKGKVVLFDQSVKHLLDDVDNTTNTWGGEMVGRRWTMTDKGLKCIDCENLNPHKHDNWDDSDKDEIRTKNITINDDGIKVNGKDAEIKIDDDGIRIKTADKEYEIKDDSHKREDKEHKK
jgi:phage shock protein PspC (stress-responsive transcriptional regulator)